MFGRTQPCRANYRHRQWQHSWITTRRGAPNCFCFIAITVYKLLDHTVHTRTTLLSLHHPLIRSCCCACEYNDDNDDRRTMIFFSVVFSPSLSQKTNKFFLRLDFCTENAPVFVFRLTTDFCHGHTPEKCIRLIPIMHDDEGKKEREEGQIQSIITWFLVAWDMWPNHGRRKRKKREYSTTNAVNNTPPTPSHEGKRRRTQYKDCQ